LSLGRTRVVVFDFDQTIAPTDGLRGLRDAKNWGECARLAPTMPFFDGMTELLGDLRGAGAEIFVASSAPTKYLRPFLARLPIGTLSNVLGYRSVPPAAGLSRRSQIKMAQLREIRSLRPDADIMFVGDDCDDAAAAAAVGVPFIHACWGGRCESIEAAHFDTPYDFSISITSTKEE
jgi:phosphoglycolate phosphatase-like HAD superfamily hydrolase